MKILVFCLLVVNSAYAKMPIDLEAIVVDNSKYIYPPPPPIDDAARMARYVVHYSNWTSLSHISHQKSQNISGLAMGRAYSVTDGELSNSTGVPYILVSLFDGVPRDLKVDPKCTMSMSMAQGDFCISRGYVAEDPRCPQVILFGNFVYITKNSDEWRFAEKAMYSRHPSMKNWPLSHNFMFGKLEINKIILVDNIGGSKYPSVKDYFNSPPPQILTERKIGLMHRPVPEFSVVQN